MSNPYGGPPYPQHGNPSQQGYPPQGSPPAGYPQRAGYPQHGFHPQHRQGPQPALTGSPIQPGHGRVVVVASYPKLAIALGMTGPTITVDGRPMRASWGETALDLPPGQHRIRVHTRYLWDVGPAEDMVPVRAGQQVPVYYVASMTGWSRGGHRAGAAGATRQDAGHGDLLDLHRPSRPIVDLLRRHDRQRGDDLTRGSEGRRQHDARRVISG